MPTFIEILTFTSVTGIFNDTKDSKKVNKALAHLQSKGARIIDIKTAVAAREETERTGTPIAFTKTVTIIYEAPQPIR
jgi:hypothetical protein